MITRRPFDSAISIRSQTVAVPSIRAMSGGHVEALLRAFDRHGFAILACEDRRDGRADLLALKRLLGRAAQHPRADADGIVPINAFAQVKGFLGSTAEEHLLHTDGAFADAPERILTLQCVTPAAVGGLSLLASAQAAYAHVAAAFPDRVRALGRHDALTIRRGAQSSTQPVFVRCGERLAIKFRMPDGAAEVTPHRDAREPFEELCRFFTAPANVARFKLEAGQVLIADNGRGRARADAVPAQ